MSETLNFHFIAIGGIGMSGLAKYLIEMGHNVSGSDLEETKYTQKIQKIGAKVYIGHKEEQVPDNSFVVASTAIRETNPEIIQAKKLGLKVHHRSDILKMLAQDLNKTQLFIGFSGTHGKTTTSGLASYVLAKANLSPSFVVGGYVPEIGTNAQYADGKFFVAELDESDGTIVKYSTDISVINNLEADHLDFFTNGLDTLVETFNTHISQSKKVVINIDNDGNKRLIKENSQKEFVTFGFENADYIAKNIELFEKGSCFDFYARDEFIAKVELTVLGKHNIYNALAVLSALSEAGVDVRKLITHFKTFSGMGRRFEFIGKENNIDFYDDYAHHPSEIKATLSSVKNSFKNRRVVAVFQPHRYTRLKGLWEDFKLAFDDCDKLFVTDVFEASEDPIEGITSENFVKDFQDKAHWISGNMQEVATKILPLLKENDVVISLGAGTITHLCPEILKLVRG
ncbi:UDP-N-acetylmuramate--L-alanine ligase [bacterium]|nr:UDP-N-acetylmuramate--L-alanine ligase [bacterium]